MPNYCTNSVTFTNADPNEIQRMADAFSQGRLFDEFVPMPAELKETQSPRDPDEDLIKRFGYDNWYDWSLNNWGTKWEADSESGGIADQTNDSLIVSFDTAWNPPIAFYRQLEDMGWGVQAHYFEPGMMFCGTYTDSDDEYYEIGEDEIPDELEEIFGISDYINDED